MNPAPAGALVRIAHLLAALALLLAALAAGAAEPPRAAEAQVKATFVYKFGDYVEWPAGSLPPGDGVLRIGVFGAEALAGELERLMQGRTMAGHPAAIERLAPGDAIGGLHLVYVGAEAADELVRVDAESRDQAVLIVTEDQGAPAALGAINFVLVDDRVRFDVALPAAERRGIRISSRLLAVARRVVGRHP